jgi:hypothetical protein
MSVNHSVCFSVTAALLCSSGLIAALGHSRYLHRIATPDGSRGQNPRKPPWPPPLPTGLRKAAARRPCPDFSTRRRHLRGGQPVSQSASLVFTRPRGTISQTAKVHNADRTVPIPSVPMRKDRSVCRDAIQSNPIQSNPIRSDPGRATERNRYWRSELPRTSWASTVPLSLPLSLSLSL